MLKSTAISMYICYVFFHFVVDKMFDNENSKILFIKQYIVTGFATVQILQMLLK